MVLDAVIELVLRFVQMNSLFLILVFVIFIFIAYKVFKAVMKALIVAFLSGIFPLVMLLMGMYQPVSLWQMFQTMVWFSLAGVAMFFIYSTMSTAAKIIKAVISPFRFMFRRRSKEKVIVKERIIEREGTGRKRKK